MVVKTLSYSYLYDNFRLSEEQLRKRNSNNLVVNANSIKVIIVKMIIVTVIQATYPDVKEVDEKKQQHQLACELNISPYAIRQILKN